VAHQLKARVTQQVRDVGFAAGEEVVYAQNVVAIVNEAVAKVRTKETGAAGDKGLIL